MSSPRDPRYAPRPSLPAAGPASNAPRPIVRPAAAERSHRAKPDANPMRLMFGLVGIASISALTAAMVPSITPPPADAANLAVADAAAADAPVVDAVAPVRHENRYIVLQPGQTAPPGAVVQSQPDPTPIATTKVVAPKATPRPKPKRVTRTRQSGKP